MNAPMPGTPAMPGGPVPAETKVKTLTIEEALTIRDNLNVAISKWGKKLGGSVSIRAMKILGRLNDGTKEFEEQRKKLFEELGEDEVKVIPATKDEAGNEASQERSEPTGNKIIPEKSVEAYNERITPFLEADSEVEADKVYGRFAEEEFEGFAPTDSDNPKEFEAFVQTMYSLRDLVKD